MEKLPTSFWVGAFSNSRSLAGDERYRRSPRLVRIHANRRDRREGGRLEYEGGKREWLKVKHRSTKDAIAGAPRLERLRRRRRLPLQRRLPSDARIAVLVQRLHLHVPPPLLRVRVRVFPHDLTHPPRSWAERTYDIVCYTVMPRGGHFAPHEEPELLAADIVAFHHLVH
jgi:pimeloyl-ACP methyl ester carboxylesterase